MKYKLRCRKKGIVVDELSDIDKYDIVWIREMIPEVYPMDKEYFDASVKRFNEYKAQLTMF